MSLKKRVYYGVFWSVLGTLISKGSIFLSTIIVARILQNSEFGELDIIQNTVGMFGVLAGLGLGLTVTKHVAELYKTDKEKISHIIGLAYVVASIFSIILVALVVSNAAYIATVLLHAPHLTHLLQIGSIMLFFNTLTGIQTSALSGLEKFKDIAHINFTIGLFSFPVIFFGVYFYGLDGVVYSLVIVSIFNFLINRYFLIKRLKEVQIVVDYLNSYKVFSLLKTYALPAFLSSIMLGPVLWVVRTFLTAEKDGYIALGIFSAAVIFQNIIYMLSNSLNGVLLPMLSSTEGKKSYLFNQVSFYTSWLLGILLTYPLIFFPEIIELILGEKYTGYDFRMTLLIIMNVVLVYTFQLGMSRLLAVKNMMWLGAMNNFIWAIILIVVSMQLVQYGSIGLALSFLIAYFINLLIFVPFFIFKNVFEYKLVINWYVIIIWILLLFNAYTSFTFSDLWFKIGVFLLSIAIFLLLTFFFVQTIKNNSKVIV